MRLSSIYIEDLLGETASSAYEITGTQKLSNSIYDTNGQRDKRTDTRDLIWCTLALNVTSSDNTFNDFSDSQLAKFCVFIGWPRIFIPPYIISMKHDASSPHRMDAPDKHNGQTNKERNGQTDKARCFIENFGGGDKSRNQQINTRNLVSWLSGKSLELLPPDVTFWG